MESNGLSAWEQARLVRRGYDRVREAYRGDDYANEGSVYQRVLDPVLPELSPDDRLLDLGCGCGVPVTKILAQRCRVTGVDLSEVQLGRARRLEPRANFIQADMCRLQFRYESFRGVVAFYSLIHVPVAGQLDLLQRIWGWLIPSGFLLATVGHQRWVGREDDWCGVQGAAMYWSHEDRETNRRWFEEAGFELEREEFMPEGNGGHTLLLARKPRRQP